MIGYLNLILCVSVYVMVLNTAESQVIVSNLNGTGNFLCGYSTRLQCVITSYGGGMVWKLDGTIVAQCAFSSCTGLSALPSGDTFTADEANGMFYLDIGITHADNGTTYVCDASLIQDQTTVNIQVPPSESAFTKNITENATSITVEAGCFYPSDAGRMDVYCVTDGKEEIVQAAITLTPTTAGCSGDCAGPNIYTATGSIPVNSSNTGGNSNYLFKVYHKDFKEYAITKDTTGGTYKCDISSNITTESTKITQTSNITTEPSTATQTIYTFSSTEELFTSPPTSSSTPPPPGTTCIIFVVVCVVELLIIIIIIIVCCCIRKRKQNKATKGLNLAKKNDKNDQNNIPLGEPVPDGMNEKKQDLNDKPTGKSVHNEINEKKQDLNKVEHKF